MTSEDDDQPREDEGSLTGSPFVAWGAWMASRHADDPAPRGVVVFGVLLGAPVALGLLLWALATWLR